MSISAVLPFKSEAGKFDQVRLSKFLLWSIYQRIEKDFFDLFFIVCPAKEIKPLQDTVAPYSDKINFCILDENELEPELGKYNKNGWRKQQLIKLAICKRVNSDFFLTLDGDVICSKQLSLDTLVKNGKGVIQKWNKNIRPNWWESSAHKLKVEANLETPGMHVTPAILSTQACKKLINRLEELSNKSWMDYLMSAYQIPWRPLIPGFKNKHQWSEYALYFTFLESSDLLSEYHYWADGQSPQLVSENSVWKRVDFNTWDPEVCYSEDDPSLFYIIQSNKYLSMEDVDEKLGDLI